MPNSGLKGPFSLSQMGVSANVNRTAPGAYALGSMNGNTFVISYVGRSDTDVATRLRQHVGKYNQFKFDYFSSPKAAFERECYLFHAFGETKLDNKVHPARPEGSNWRCPHCNIFS